MLSSNILGTVGPIQRRLTHCPVVGTRRRHAVSAAVAVAGRAGTDLGLWRGLGAGDQGDRGEGRGGEEHPDHARLLVGARGSGSATPPRSRGHDRRIVIAPLHLRDPRHPISPARSTCSSPPISSTGREATSGDCRSACFRVACSSFCMRQLPGVRIFYKAGFSVQRRKDADRVPLGKRPGRSFSSRCQGIG
jgi:hypothetical protein